MTGDSGGRDMAGTRLPHLPHLKGQKQNSQEPKSPPFFLNAHPHHPRGTFSWFFKALFPNTRVSCDCCHSVTNGWLIFLTCYLWATSWRSWGPLYCQNRNWGLWFLNTPKFSFWIKADRTGAVTTSFWKRVVRTYLLCNKHSKIPLHTHQKEYIIFWIISLKNHYSCF